MKPEKLYADEYKTATVAENTTSLIHRWDTVTTFDRQ